MITAPPQTDDRLDTATALLEEAYDFCTRFELTRRMVQTQLGRPAPPDTAFPRRWYAQAEALLLSR